MADALTPQRRSENMRRIRSKNTKPEMIVRSQVHRLGFRYRLHGKDLPGKPDLVFRKRKKAIFVHGCFWHQHSACREGRVPGSRPQYWIPKLQGNKDRDAAHLSGLQTSGWQILVIWECEVSNQSQLNDRLLQFLED